MIMYVREKEHCLCGERKGGLLSTEGSRIVLRRETEILMYCGERQKCLCTLERRKMFWREADMFFLLLSEEEIYCGEGQRY